MDPSEEENEEREETPDLGIIIRGYTTKFFKAARKGLDKATDKVKYTLKKGKGIILMHHLPSDRIAKQIAKLDEESIKTYFLKHFSTMSLYQKRVLLLGMGNQVREDMFKRLVDQGNGGSLELRLLCEEVCNCKLEDLVPTLRPAEGYDEYVQSVSRPYKSMLRRIKDLIEKFRSRGE